VTCAAAGCRTTGGGKQPSANTCPVIGYVTHGGQVGAPFGQAGAPDCASGAGFNNPCIRGEFQHVRHIKGGLRGTFHAASNGNVHEFDSLLCACLPCDHTDVASPFSGCHPADRTYSHQNAVVNGLCNPGDRVCGPEPRRAPANKICFSGVGDFTFAAGPKTVPAVFRVDIEDRGEPGNAWALSKNGKPNRVPDRYRIRIWVLTDAELRQLNSATGADPYLLSFRNAISACNGIDYRDGGICGPNACSGSDCDGSGTTGTITFPGGAPVRSPNVDDGGELLHGNHQIHPMIKACNPLDPTGPGLAKP
jgi:hypothetical protein